MGERDTAQAEVLVRALCDLRDKMISQMTWLEKHDARLDAKRCGETSMKLRPTSLVCNAATWVEMCGHLNPLARPGNTTQSAWPVGGGAVPQRRCGQGLDRIFQSLSHTLGAKSFVL